MNLSDLWSDRAVEETKRDEALDQLVRGFVADYDRLADDQAELRRLKEKFAEENAELLRRIDAGADALASQQSVVLDALKAAGVQSLTLDGRGTVTVKKTAGSKSVITKKLLTELLGAKQADELWARVPKKDDTYTLSVSEVTPPEV